MRKTRNMLLEDNKRLRKITKELLEIDALLKSSDETKHKIVMDKLLEFRDRRRLDDEDNDISFKDIPLSDFQIWNCRRMKSIL